MAASPSHDSYAAIISGMTTIAFIFVIGSLRPPGGKLSRPGNMIKQVRQGIHFVWTHELILGTVSLDLFAVLLGGAVYLLPVFARDILTDPLDFYRFFQRAGRF